jgi:hypothetical protein
LKVDNNVAGFCDLLDFFVANLVFGFLEIPEITLNRQSRKFGYICPKKCHKIMLHEFKLFQILSFFAASL